MHLRGCLIAIFKLTSPLDINLPPRSKLAFVQGSKLIFWITNPFELVGINFTNQIIKFVIEESVLEISIF